MFAVVTATVPHRWCAREAGAWFAGDVALQGALARGVERFTGGALSETDFATGSEQFNGEWLFGTYMMAGMGFGQTALEHPELRNRNLAALRRCARRLLSEQVRRFDRASWGEDPIATLDGTSGHAAYLGYLNLVLGLDRVLDPASPHAALHDRITGALARRLEASPILLLETYPGEVYPVDNCAVVGSIALHQRAAGSDHSALLARWSKRCRERSVDAATGLLVQCVEAESGRAADAPRGSGTALASYFLSFADAGLSGDLWSAARRELAGTLFGFGSLREYPAGAPPGRGDIDSGPLVLGRSISATGFSLAAARTHGDEEWFTSAYATAHLFGAPLDRDDAREYVSGGPIGNALLFALLTAQPASAWSQGAARSPR